MPAQIFSLEFQLLTTCFVALLFAILHFRFKRNQFFGTWTGAWICLAGFVLVSVIFHQYPDPRIGTPLTLCNLMLAYAYAGLFWHGARQMVSGKRLKPKHLALCIIAAGAVNCALYLLLRNTGLHDVVTSGVRQLCLAGVYYYAALCFLRLPYTRERLTGIVGSVSCLILAANQMIYCLMGAAGVSAKYDDLRTHFSTLGVLWNALDAAAQFGIIVGAILIVLERHWEQSVLLLEETEARIRLESQSRTLIEHLSAVTYVLKNDGGPAWTYISPQIASFGWIVGPLCFSSWIESVLPEDRETVIHFYCAAARHAASLEYRIQTGNSVVWVSDTATPALGVDGGATIHGVIVDITERKAIESRMLQASKMESLGKLASGVSHDFNNLLTIVKGYCDLAKSTQDFDQIREYLDYAHCAADKATDLSRQLLTFSRKSPLDPKLVNINDRISAFLPMLERTMPNRIKLVTKLDQTIPQIKIDPLHLEQVLLNLVLNARDAMPNGGSITISSFERKNGDRCEVCLSIVDQGMGIAPDIRSRLFEPFFTTKEEGSGTGLGLPVVQAAVAQAGGEIYVDTEVGVGTTFICCFTPAAPMKAQAAAAGSFAYRPL